MKIAIVTGGFDPITKGHIELFKDAASRAHTVYAFANSDEWLARKKGKQFMDQEQRVEILSALRCIDSAHGMSAEDDADDTAIAAIKYVQHMHLGAEILFMNGGDRGDTNTPEAAYADASDNVTMVYGVGGTNKDYSSSWLLSGWTQNITKRKWGYFNVVGDSEQCKIKQLFIKPGESISLQLHNHRSEHWVINSGIAEVTIDNGIDTKYIGDYVYVGRGTQHKIYNPGSQMLEIIEIQQGSILDEEDIIRFP